MVHRIPRTERPPRNRLEGWLVEVIESGALKSLPCYAPVRDLGLFCPDDYARSLLTGLRRSESDRSAVEGLKDDGRAFRSWAERALPSPPVAARGVAV